MSDDFGPRPERDAVELSPEERAAWRDFPLSYGEWADPDTEVRQRIQYAATLPAAVQSAVSNTQARTATSAWERAATELDAHRRELRHFRLVSTAIGAVGGFAIGVGLTALVLGVWA